MTNFLKRWLRQSPLHMFATIRRDDLVEMNQLYFMNYKMNQLKQHRRSHDGLKISWKRNPFV